MHADIVSARPGNEVVAPRIQGQQLLFILQQHQGPTDGVPGEGPVRGTADLITVGGCNLRWQSPVHQSSGNFSGEDTVHGLVYTRHWDRSGLHLKNQVVDRSTPVLGHHHHVYARIDRLGTAGVGAPLYLTDTVPVTDHKALKSKLTTQHLGQQMFVAVHLVAIPAIEGGHHRHDPRIDGGPVTGTVHAEQGFEG